jgi:hypothetical protein
VTFGKEKKKEILFKGQTHAKKTLSDKKCQ